MSGKTFGEHIAALKATRDESVKRANEIAQKAMDEGRSLETAEQAELDDLAAKKKRLDGDIVRYASLEASAAASAQPVSGEPTANATATEGSRPLNPVSVKNTEKLEPGIGFARLARVKALAFTGQAGTRDEAQIAKHLYPSDEKLVQSLVQKAPVPAANTLNEPWASNLINDAGAPFADFVEWLRARTVYGQVSSRFRRLPFDAPVLVQGSGGTAQWVKEGAAKPLTQWTYTRAKLTPLKVAAIAAATKETLMRASVAADTFLRDELGRAVGSAIDMTLVSDTAAVTDEAPAGLRNGTTPLTLAGDGTVAGIRCDIAQFLKELVGDNLTVSGAFWIMSEGTAIDLSMATNEVGAPAFPGITPTGGTLAGLPVFTSQYVADESEGAVVMLVKGDEIFLGDEGGLQVSVSDQASLEMDSAPTQDSTVPTASTVVSMWQTNSVAFLVERFVNWQKRRAQALVWAHVNWDACNS